jgi:hypothetical protein
MKIQYKVSLYPLIFSSLQYHTVLLYQILIYSSNYNLNKEFANYETFAKQLNKVFVDYKITKCIQKIHFLAQVYVETNRFRSTYEDKPKSTYWGGVDSDSERGFKYVWHTEDHRSVGRACVGPAFVPDRPFHASR